MAPVESKKNFQMLGHSPRSCSRWGGGWLPLLRTLPVLSAFQVSLLTPAVNFHAASQYHGVIALAPYTHRKFDASVLFSFSANFRNNRVTVQHCRKMLHGATCTCCTVRRSRVQRPIMTLSLIHISEPTRPY